MFAVREQETLCYTSHYLTKCEQAMLKGQDCVILIKLLANQNQVDWSQRELAKVLNISLSEINAGLKRLSNASLIRLGMPDQSIIPVVQAAYEFLVHGVKYCFATQLGEFTRGVPTGIAAPVFKDKIVVGDDPLPVWPYGMGNAKGLSIEPLYKSVPSVLEEHFDQKFYDILALVDILRIGRAREKKIAEEMLQKIVMSD